MNIYTIQDESDGSELLSISTDSQRQILTKLKAQTDKIWYALENAEDYGKLPRSYREAEQTTVNGDWVEIFIALLNQRDISYKVVTINTI